MWQFQRHEPTPQLRSWVNGYWLLEAVAPAADRACLAPDGYPELVFALKGALQYQIGGKPWATAAPAGLIGQLSQGFVPAAAPGERFLFVKLHPLTPYALFKTPAHLLTDAVTDLSALSARPELRQLVRELGEEPSPLAAIGRVERWLLGRLAHRGQPGPLLHRAVHTIFRKHGVLRIDALSEAAGLSNRYLEMLFKQQLGLSPKGYARLIRVKKASIWLADPHFSGSAASIAAALDYFDPTHFGKDFKTVTGLSPAAFRAGRLPFRPEDCSSYLSQWDYS